jgi:pyridoxal phosphate enzyme (YggS family)
MSRIEDNYHRVLGRIAAAVSRSGRSTDSVRLIGVTKRIDRERIQQAIDCGLTEIGENRVQEAEQKFPDLDTDNVRCHLIGHLQTNKANKAVHLFSCIQTVDSVSLAQRLDRLAEGPIDVLIQLKLGEEESKQGAARSDLPVLVDTIGNTRHLRLVGLMGIPPFFNDVDQVRPYFRQLKTAAEEFSLPEVSMGMSHDFEVAIEEGATIVRVGTALFGERADP